ncbi:MAG: ferritin-like domain-containing protein [Gemmatimonadaceae bacterium]|nr:ferritin-like domain-containing protein [Gemmatimonadaceae bacterium]
MTNTQTILDGIEPEVMTTLVNRRDAIRKGATTSASLAMGLKFASVPLALAALSRDAYGQASSTVQDVLNFALKLEIFENELYKAVLGTSAVAAANTAFAPVRALAAAVPGAVATLQQLQKHETQHTAFLLANGAVNDLNLTGASFDFTGARGAGNGPFARATTELQFLLLVAQSVEDTGVRAYKGQAGNLISNKAVLEAALRIHSVEGRHAAKIRRMRRQTNPTLTSVKFSGTITGGGIAAAGAGNISNPPAAVVAALEAIYGGATSEANLVQAGRNAATVSGSALPPGLDQAPAAQEAFDEPLTKAEVVAIVQPFFIPTLT